MQESQGQKRKQEKANLDPGTAVLGILSPTSGQIRALVPGSLN